MMGTKEMRESLKARGAMQAAVLSAVEPGFVPPVIFAGISVVLVALMLFLVRYSINLWNKFVNQFICFVFCVRALMDRLGCSFMVAGPQQALQTTFISFWRQQLEC